MNFVLVFVQNPYIFSRSSTVVKRPYSPLRINLSRPWIVGVAGVTVRAANISRQEERRSEYCKGVFSGVLNDTPSFGRGLYEGKIDMWRGLFFYLSVLRIDEDLLGRHTFFPITPRQAIEGAVIVGTGICAQLML